MKKFFDFLSSAYLHCRVSHFLEMRDAVFSFTKVVKLDLEKDNVGSMLPNIVQIDVEIHKILNSNVEIHNIVSKLI